jgi:hypothetical protein
VAASFSLVKKNNKKQNKQTNKKPNSTFPIFWLDLD